MEEKYLPLGTVCSINNYNKPIMIIGYFSISYNNSVIMHDYKGCFYPEGLLLENAFVSFDHKDINEILFKGYNGEEFDKLNRNLNSQQLESDNKKLSSSIFKNIKFDENGVVVYEEQNFDNVVEKPKEEIQTTRENPFYSSYSDDKIEESTSTKEWPIFKNIQFDENGVVISAEEN